MSAGLFLMNEVANGNETGSAGGDDDDENAHGWHQPLPLSCENYRVRIVYICLYHMDHSTHLFPNVCHNQDHASVPAKRPSKVVGHVVHSSMIY